MVDQIKNNVSFIIPCFNPNIAALGKCIESISSQILDKDEIVIIDDGSCNSRQIKKLVSSCAKTKLIALPKNKGVSNARNIGIEKAKTEWLTFVDCDDYILPNTIVAIRKKLSPKTDVAIGGIRHRTRNSTHNFLLANKNNISKMRQEIICPRAFLKNNKTKCVGIVAGKFYRTNFIKNSELSFCKNIKRAEDHIFFLDVLAKNPNIQLIDCIFYSLEYDENSTTRKYTDDLYLNFSITIRELEKRIDKTNPTEKQLLQARQGDYSYQSLINEFRPENQRSFLEKRKRANKLLNEQKQSLKEFKKIIKKKKDKIFLFILQHHFYVTTALLLRIFYRSTARRTS